MRLHLPKDNVDRSGIVFGFGSAVAVTSDSEAEKRWPTHLPQPALRRAFVFDGSVHRKTLALSDNLLSGDLPAWALQRSAADPSLVVLLQVQPGDNIYHEVFDERKYRSTTQRYLTTQ